VAGAAALVIVAGGAVLATGAGSPSPAGPSQPGTPLAGASPASTASPASAGSSAAAGGPDVNNGDGPGGSGPGQAPYPGVPADHVTTVAAGALPGAGGHGVVTLVVLSGAPSVSVRVARLESGDLLAAATAPGYGARPVAEVNRAGGDGRSAGVIGLSLDPVGAEGGTGPAGGAQLSVTLSAGVTWQLDFGGGTTQTTVDLTGGHVAGLDFGQGSSQVRVTLPRPDGTTRVRLDGGASQLSIAVPGGVPARVTAGAGAGQVLLGGHSYTGIAGGTVLAQPGWSGAPSRVDVDATSGASQISVTAAA
jgi:hypothetical protein